MALLPRHTPTCGISEIRTLFRAARDKHLAPYNWIPPEWDEVVLAGFDLADTSPAENGFKSPGAVSDSPEDTLDYVETHNAFTAETQPGNAPSAEKWVHPFSDFRHIDPDEFSDEDIEQLGPVTGANAEAFEKLKKVVGGESHGTARLTRVFQWTLWRATVLLNDINKALENQDLAAFRLDPNQQPATQQTKYEAARNHYISFLTDIDDHEPETKPDAIEPLDPRFRSAYGRAIKWACIDPVIVGGRIKEARVIIKWNPHLSSSGIAINHG
jgi:hypothetical protein